MKWLNRLKESEPFGGSVSTPLILFSHNNIENKAKTAPFHENKRPDPTPKTPKTIEGEEETRAIGYGCGKCQANNYLKVADGWRCEGCGKVFEIIGGSRGPYLLSGPVLGYQPGRRRA